MWIISNKALIDAFSSYLLPLGSLELLIFEILNPMTQYQYQQYCALIFYISEHTKKAITF